MSRWPGECLVCDSGDARSPGSAGPPWGEGRAVQSDWIGELMFRHLSSDTDCDHGAGAVKRSPGGIARCRWHWTRGLKKLGPLGPIAAAARALGGHRRVSERLPIFTAGRASGAAGTVDARRSCVGAPGYRVQQCDPQHSLRGRDLSPQLDLCRLPEGSLDAAAAPRSLFTGPDNRGSCVLKRTDFGHQLFREGISE